MCVIQKVCVVVCALRTCAFVNKFSSLSGVNCVRVFVSVGCMHNERARGLGLSKTVGLPSEVA